METGQSSHNNDDSTQLTPLDYSANNIAENEAPDHHYDDDRIRTPQVMNHQLPWWVQHQEAIPHDSYIKFLLENSASPLVPPLAAGEHGALLAGTPLPGTQNSYDLSGNWPWNHCLGVPPSSEADAWRLRLLMQQSEDLGNQFSATMDQPQSSWRQNASYTNNVPQVGAPGASIASVVRSLSSAESRGSKLRPNTNDRKRRNRIHENLNALQELLPHSAEGYPGSVLDDVIDHVKFLQLKIKDLSKTRLESESPVVPVIFREGYGHYLCDQGVLGEPLEEVMGKLLEKNPTRAMQLLEMKGLLLLPIEYTQGLC